MGTDPERYGALGSSRRPVLVRHLLASRREPFERLPARSSRSWPSSGSSRSGVRSRRIASRPTPTTSIRSPKCSMASSCTPGAGSPRRWMSTVTHPPASPRARTSSAPTGASRSCASTRRPTCAIGGLTARQDDDETLRALGDRRHVARRPVHGGRSRWTRARCRSPNWQRRWRPAAAFLGVALDEAHQRGAAALRDERSGVALRRVGAQRHLVRRTPRGWRPSTAHSSRTRLGNVHGGIRTPHVDVPTAVLSGLGNSGGDGLGFLAGRHDTLRRESSSQRSTRRRTEYLARFDAATEAAVAAGFVLAADADEIKAVAAENSPV